MCEFLKKNWKNGLLVIGTGCVSIGCAITFLCPESVKWGSFFLLLGTISIGIGFYLKSKSTNSLSSYGHFMLGLATLITLPQAPEMLKHVLDIKKSNAKIEQGVNKLEIAQKAISDSNDAITKSVKELENAIKNLNATITGPAAKSLAPEIKNAKTPEERNKIIEELANNKRFSGEVYLSRPNADAIKEELQKNYADQSKIEALFREKLEIKRFDDKK